MHRILCMLAIFALPLSHIVAQEAVTIQRTLLLPQNFYVGDQVEMRMTLRVPDMHRIEMPQHIRQPGWGSIGNIRIHSDDIHVELRIQFTSYVPGIITLPDIQLGTFRLSGVPVYVNSILKEQKQELQGLRQQLLLPHTTLFILLCLSVLFGIPLLIYLIKKPLLKIYRYLLQKYQLRKPYRQFNSQMKVLKHEMGDMSEKQFYIDLTTHLRTFLSDEVSPHCLAATSRELPAIILKEGIDKNMAERIAELFLQSDFIKFASHHNAIGEREEHFGQAEGIAHELYKEIEEQHRGNR